MEIRSRQKQEIHSSTKILDRHILDKPVEYLGRVETSENPQTDAEAD
jgi:hypothetical protein